MAKKRKKHQTKEEISSKIYYGKYTNRVVMKSSYVGITKLVKAMEDSELDHKIYNGYDIKVVYYLNPDHDKVLDVITNKVKARRIETISRPFNDKAQTEMIGDKHLMIVKALPFKKYRYKVVFKDLRKVQPNFDFLKTQSEIGVVKLSYMLRQYFQEERRKHWWWFGEDYFYVEDEATTSMASLLYSDIIKKIYIYKTYEEMTESQ